MFNRRILAVLVLFILIFVISTLAIIALKPEMHKKFIPQIIIIKKEVNKN